MEMKEAVIVAACRTAVGKAPRGMLKDTRPEQMGCAVLGDLLGRAGGLDPSEATARVLDAQIQDAEPLTDAESAMAVSIESGEETGIESVLTRISSIS